MEALIGPPPFGKKKLIEPADFEESVRQSAGEDDPASSGDSNKSDESSSSNP